MIRSSGGARRWLIGTVALLALTACGGGGGTSNPVASHRVTSPGAVEFKETEYTIAPSTLSLKPGTYTFHVQNVGQFPHDLRVATSADGTEVGNSPVMLAKGDASFKITLQPGKYTIWCSVDAHRSLGMEATITVQ